jgi:hypothetical protein
MNIKNFVSMNMALSLLITVFTHAEGPKSAFDSGLGQSPIAAGQIDDEPFKPSKMDQLKQKAKQTFDSTSLTLKDKLGYLYRKKKVALSVVGAGIGDGVNLVRGSKNPKKFVKSFKCAFWDQSKKYDDINNLWMNRENEIDISNVPATIHRRQFEFIQNIETNCPNDNTYELFRARIQYEYLVEKENDPLMQINENKQLIDKLLSKDIDNHDFRAIFKSMQKLGKSTKQQSQDIQKIGMDDQKNKVFYAFKKCSYHNIKNYVESVLKLNNGTWPRNLISPTEYYLRCLYVSKHNGKKDWLKKSPLKARVNGHYMSMRSYLKKSYFMPTDDQMNNYNPNMNAKNLLGNADNHLNFNQDEFLVDSNLS